MIKFKHKGDFKKTDKFFNFLKKRDYLRSLNQYGEEGVNALRAMTPVDTGRTASMWGYDIEVTDSSVKIVWFNENENKGVNIAIIIQYGHGTGTGGYVQGIDYVNPAMRSVFENIADNVWKEVESA